MTRKKKRVSTSSSVSVSQTAAEAAGRLELINKKADIKMTVAKYGQDFLTVVASVIRSDTGEPLALTKSAFKAMAVQKPNGWSTSDKLTVGGVSKPTPGIHVFALTGFSNGVPPGPYAIALTVMGKWQGQAVAKIQI